MCSFNPTVSYAWQNWGGRSLVHDVITIVKQICLDRLVKHGKAKATLDVREANVYVLQGFRLLRKHGDEIRFCLQHLWCKHRIDDSLEQDTEFCDVGAVVGRCEKDNPISRDVNAALVLELLVCNSGAIFESLLKEWKIRMLFAVALGRCNSLRME
jgi:hypothetical protein